MAEAKKVVELPEGISFDIQTVQLPQEGIYQIHVADANRKGSTTFIVRGEYLIGDDRLLQEIRNHLIRIGTIEASVDDEV